MVKQIINIICIPILYNILDEIKDNLSFKVENFDGTGKVFFDESEIENFAFYENNVEFNVPMEIIEEKGPGVYEVYLKMMYGGVDLVSESKGFEFTEREEATP